MPKISSRWRLESRRICDEILVEAKAGDWTIKDVNTAIRARYPFGVREYTPYKIWLEEAKLCRMAFAANICMDAMYNRIHYRPTGKPKPLPVLEGQISLLELLPNGE